MNKVIQNNIKKKKKKKIIEKFSSSSTIVFTKYNLKNYTWYIYIYITF